MISFQTIVLDNIEDYSLFPGFIFTLIRVMVFTSSMGFLCLSYSTCYSYLSKAFTSIWVYGMHIVLSLLTQFPLVCDHFL